MQGYPSLAKGDRFRAYSRRSSRVQIPSLAPFYSISSHILIILLSWFSVIQSAGWVHHDRMTPIEMIAMRMIATKDHFLSPDDISAIVVTMIPRNGDAIRIRTPANRTS